MISHLSPSQINTYTTCPKRWYYRYVLGLKRPPGIALIRGSAVHQGYADALNYKILWGDIPPQELITEITVDIFNNELEQWLGEITLREGETIGKFLDDSVRISKYLHREKLPKVDPVIVEERIEIELGGINYICVLDVREKEKIRDLKIVGRKPQRDETKKDIQSISYAYVGKTVYNYTPEVNYDYVVCGKNLAMDEFSTGEYSDYL